MALSTRFTNLENSQNFSIPAEFTTVDKEELDDWGKDTIQMFKDRTPGIYLSGAYLFPRTILQKIFDHPHAKFLAFQMVYIETGDNALKPTLVAYGHKETDEITGDENDQIFVCNDILDEELFLAEASLETTLLNILKHRENLQFAEASDDSLIDPIPAPTSFTNWWQRFDLTNRIASYPEISSNGSPLAHTKIEALYHIATLSGTFSFLEEEKSPTIAVIPVILNVGAGNLSGSAAVPGDYVTYILAHIYNNQITGYQNEDATWSLLTGGATYPRPWEYWNLEAETAFTQDFINMI